MNKIFFKTRLRFELQRKDKLVTVINFFLFEGCHKYIIHRSVNFFYLIKFQQVRKKKKLLRQDTPRICKIEEKKNCARLLDVLIFELRCV